MEKKSPINFGNAFVARPGEKAPPMPSSDTTPPSGSLVSKSYKDIVYASQSIDQKLDVYLPAAHKSPYRVAAWFHGGGWFLGNKQEGIAEVAEPFLTEGYAVVSADYRLTRRATFPAQIFDAKTVIRWVRANHAKYHFDPDKIIAAGASAGGHLASLLGTSGGIRDLEDLSTGNSEYSSRVNAAVVWYGPIDFLTMDSQHAALGQEGYHAVDNSPESLLLGGPISENEEKCRKANPMTYINKDNPPFYIQHGKNDVAVPYLQSICLAEALKTVIGEDKVYLELPENAGHGDSVHMSPEHMKKVFAFLDTHLK